MEITREDRASGVIFDAARQAGFEDGIDFVITGGPDSFSPRMREWLDANQFELMVDAFLAFTTDD